MSPVKTAALALLVTVSAIVVPAHAGNVDEVIKSGVLRACTPGDYKPFSFAKPDGTEMPPASSELNARPQLQDAFEHPASA